MPTSFDARLFGGGAPVTGEPATVVVSAEDITVAAADRELSCPIRDLRVREVGFGRDTGYELAWQDGEQMYAVHVLGAEAIGALRASPVSESAQLRSLAQGARARTAGRALGWTMIAALVAAPFIVIGLMLANADRVAQLVTRQIPISQEVRLGEAAFESLRPSLQLVEQGAGYDAVQRIGSLLSSTSSYRYRFYVARDDAINAFALPGGIVVVYTGLIASTHRPEELAGVLAHEIQHVEQRHSLHAAVKNLGLRAVWMWISGDVGGSLGSRAALELTSRKFSRDAERAADAGALEMLAHHRIDPGAMADFFARMSERTSGQVPALLSTHPSDAERHDRLREATARLPLRSFEPLVLGSWPPTN